MPLYLLCQSCRKEGESGEISQGLCLNCYLSRLLQDEQREMGRLQAKANRYGSKGLSLVPLRRQAQRIFERTYRKSLYYGIRNFGWANASPEKLMKVLNQLFVEFLPAEVRPRIEIPGVGGVLETLSKDERARKSLAR